MQNLHLIYGFIFGTLGQICSFLQLQGSAKWGWYEKYPSLILLSAIPAAWFYIQSVNNFIAHFNGTLWPSRFLGFSIGIIVFTILSYTLFKEPLTIKVAISMLLSALIMAVQIFMK
jgi:hypothetical protein